MWIFEWPLGWFRAGAPVVITIPGKVAATRFSMLFAKSTTKLPIVKGGH